MTMWKKKCMEFTEVRKAINEGRTKDIIEMLIKICDKYGKQKWLYAESFATLSEEIQEEVDGDADEDTVDFWLNEFYDLCDAAKVWLEV